MFTLNVITIVSGRYDGIQLLGSSLIKEDLFNKAQEYFNGYCSETGEPDSPAPNLTWAYDQKSSKYTAEDFPESFDCNVFIVQKV